MKKPPEFVIACKNNQARSIVATAALRAIYPEFTFKSFGVDASKKGQIPRAILEILNVWGLSKYDRYSSRLEDLDLLRIDSYFLAADSYVFERLKGSVPNLSSIEEVVLNHSLLPIDPAGLDYMKYPTELSKFVLAANRWFEIKSKSELVNIDALLFTSKKSLTDFDWQQFNKPDFVIIDTNVVYPYPIDHGIEGFDLKYFNPRELECPSNFSTVAGSILFSKYEFSKISRLMLSKSWRNFLEQVSKKKKRIILLCYPFTEISINLEIEILGAIHASSISLIE